MKRMSRVPFPLLMAASFAVASCSAFHKAEGTPVAAVKDPKPAPAGGNSFFSKLPKLPDFSLASLLPGSGVKVVPVRKKDLKDLPTGHELAMAHQHEGGFWLFGGPVNFKEPALPAPGSELDGSLLPPRSP